MTTEKLTQCLVHSINMSLKVRILTCYILIFEDYNSILATGTCRSKMIANNMAATHMLTIYKSLKMETNTMIFLCLVKTSNSIWIGSHSIYHFILVLALLPENSFLSFLPSFIELLWESNISLFLYSASRLILQTINLSSWISTNKTVDNGF